MSELIFWLCAFMMFYIFAGYPALILLLSKFKSPVSHSPIKEYPTVEVIIVVRNAESYVAEKIASIQNLDYPADKIRTLFISDNSTDGTVDVINKLTEVENDTDGVEGQEKIRVVDNEFKSSKSACLNQAIKLSNADLLLLTDIRQTLESDSLQKLARHFSDDSVGAVSGELVLRDSDGNDFGSGMDAYWRYEKFIRHHESLVDSVPGVTGAIYAMRRELYQDIPAETLLDDVLIPMNLILKNKKVLFEPEAIAYDIPSSDIGREKIRKTRTLAGNWQLLQLRPMLLNPLKNRIWLQFISHKILRLISPLCLLLMFFASILAAKDSAFFVLVSVLQIVVYGTLLVALKKQQLLKHKPIKIAYSFMVLMYFTVLGFLFFVSKKHLQIWK
ncbi:glycosyltransferase family 2 protein [Aliikangiella coralliicola]|uniref:Glycosyltransferase family 2 protein n=1 Tax=Aliikangiella coralliicola TaxID=2592383 RepID=A0A545UHE2_9GAMM|nr:glycosyltransferase family 2 protein [Aliikangiella coralliicola]TQV88882.1 glycosyltransferase family 2 protein [Aliikangiella coralliicola]